MLLCSALIEERSLVLSMPLFIFCSRFRGGRRPRPPPSRSVAPPKTPRGTPARPFARSHSQVGGFFFIHRDDLARLAPLWLKYTEDVRADPEARVFGLFIS